MAYDDNQVDQLLGSQEQPQESQEATTTPQESSKEQNLRNLRERMEASERRAQEIERRNYELEHIIKSKLEPQVQVEEDDDIPSGDDDSYIERRDLKKIVRGLKKELQNTKKEIQEYSAKSQISQAEIKLKSQFPDFERVVTEEGLRQLSTSRPSLFRSIMANPDIYDRGYTAYELLKSSGHGNADYEDIDKRIDNNRMRPKSGGAAPSQSPLARVSEYSRREPSEDRKEELRRKLDELKKRG